MTIPENSASRSTIKAGFGRFCSYTAGGVASPWAFVAAFGIIILWAVSGPVYHYSDTWQLIINTGTTIITFLMVFLIQNTQNRDARAIHLKLDELIHSIDTAKNQMIDIEHLSDADLDLIAERYKLIQAQPNEPSRTTERAAP